MRARSNKKSTGQWYVKMKKLIWVFIFVITCANIGCRHGGTYAEEQKNEDTTADSISVPKLSDEDINEIIRMADSLKKYGIKEGVRRFHKDSVHISDEDTQMVSDMVHEILDEIKTKNKNENK